MSTIPPSSASLPADAPAPKAAPKGARKSTIVVMVATLLTKLVGLAREIMLSAILGTGAVLSAFTVAFQIPNVIRTFVADQALVGSLVPVFTGLREDDEEDRAWRVASTMVSILLLILVPVTALAMYFAPHIIDLLVYDKFDQMPLAVELFRILVGIVGIMSIGGVVIAILNSYGKFGAAAFALLLFNVVSIIVILALYPLLHGKHNHAVLYSSSLLVATLAQSLFPVPWLKGHNHALVLGRAFRDPAVRAVLVAMAPVMMSLSMLSLNNIVNTYWSSRVPAALMHGVRDGGPGLIYRANSIFQLPQGIFSMAVSTVFFPMFALYAARSDMPKFGNSVGAAVRQIIVLLMPATIFMWLLAEPITQLLFQHGASTHAEILASSGALRGFAFGLIGNGAAGVLMWAFFSIRSPWTPAIVGFFFNLLAHIVLGGLLYEHHGLFGVTLAMAIANTAVFIALWFVLQRKIGHMDVMPILSAVVLSGVSAAVSVAVGWLAWRGIRDVLGTHLIGQGLSMMVAVGLTWTIYSLLAFQLRLVNIPQLRRLRGRKG